MKFKHFLICCILDEFVAQFKFTVLLMPNGPMKITGGEFNPDCYSSEHSIKDEDLKASAESVQDRTPLSYFNSAHLF